jgi:hypothetical protein
MFTTELLCTTCRRSPRDSTYVQSVRRPIYFSEGGMGIGASEFQVSTFVFHEPSGAC